MSFRSVQLLDRDTIKCVNYTQSSSFQYFMISLCGYHWHNSEHDAAKAAAADISNCHTEVCK